MSTDYDEEPPASRPRWRPRIPGQAVAFIGVLCAGVLIGWVVFRDDDGPPPAPAGTVAVLDQRTRLDVNRRQYPRLGLSLSMPKGWKPTVRQGVFNARSRDNRVSVAISAAGGPGDARKVRVNDRRELKRLFRARQLNQRPGRVGPARTVVTEFLGRTRKGQQIRILSMGASSRWRTYSVQVFTALRPTSARVVELSTLIASVRFSRPR